MSFPYLRTGATSISSLRSLRLPRGLSWTTLGLIGILLLAAALRFGNIDAIGQANTYYTAAVESMLQSWHNFFFAAAEPGGSVSVDKPPVGLWLQAISAYFLGVNGFAVVLPQILAGIASVAVIFHLVRRSFGNLAGLLAALILAVTPVAIAVERNNTPDATLILTLLLAAWAFIKATESGKVRFLLLGATLVGIGFNIKMLQAFLPLPAFYALYILGAKQNWWRKILNLFLATLVLIPVSLSWALAVDLTPADQRPYVGSSSNNSALDLIFGYNGMERLVGRGGGGSGGSGMPSQSRGSDDSSQNTNDVNQGQPPAMSDAQPDGARPSGGPPAMGGGRPTGGGGPGGGSPGGGGMFGIGEASALRLFESGLAAQVSWLLPFALLAIAAMVVSLNWWNPNTALHHGLILWGGWLLTCVVFFSVAGFFHQYYLAMLGAPLAAVVAIGMRFLWQLRDAHPIRSALLLLVATGVTLAFQVYAVGMYDSLGWWVALPVALGGLGAIALLLSLWRKNIYLPKIALGMLVAGLLIVPTVWSGLTTAYANTSSAMTQAYSGGNSRRGMGNPGGGAQQSNPNTSSAEAQPSTTSTPEAPGNAKPTSEEQSLVAYLQAHTQDTKYLVVVPSSQAGTSYVLETGRPVLYAGGFSGRDPVIDGEDLAELVTNGDVRYVLWGGGGGGGSDNSSISSYLQSSCTVVTDAGISRTGSQRSGGGPGGSSTLYECGG